MLTTCAHPGCTTLVLGGRCLEHESPQTRVFVRGRPFVPARTATAATGVDEALLRRTRPLPFAQSSVRIPHGV